MRLSDQNNPSKHGFFAPFCKKRKDGFRNKLNINTLHFCILHFAKNGCADCSVASPSKKGKGKNLVLHTQAENGFFPFVLDNAFSYRLVAVRMSTNRPKIA